MLSEAKDTSELMVDLGYAVLFFADPGMAGEVAELEERLAAEGIVLTTLATEGIAEAVLRRVCDLHNACLRDIPRADHNYIAAFLNDSFLERGLGHPVRCVDDI